MSPSSEGFFCEVGISGISLTIEFDDELLKEPDDGISRILRRFLRTLLTPILAPLHRFMGNHQLASILRDVLAERRNHIAIYQQNQT
jgi:hypothetical protein